jgi:hypothetical protein
MPGSPCAEFGEEDLLALASIAEDCLWLLECGCDCGSLADADSRRKELLGAQADPALFVKRALDKRFSARFWNW